MPHLSSWVIVAGILFIAATVWGSWTLGIILFVRYEIFFGVSPGMLGSWSEAEYKKHQEEAQRRMIRQAEVARKLWPIVLLFFVASLMALMMAVAAS